MKAAGKYRHIVMWMSHHIDGWRSMTLDIRWNILKGLSLDHHRRLALRIISVSLSHAGLLTPASLRQETPAPARQLCAISLYAISSWILGNALVKHSFRFNSGMHMAPWPQPEALLKAAPNKINWLAKSKRNTCDFIVHLLYLLIFIVLSPSD